MKNLIHTAKHTKEIIEDKNKDPRLKEAEELEARAIALREEIEAEDEDDFIWIDIDWVYKTLNSAYVDLSVYGSNAVSRDKIMSVLRYLEQF